jgi:hypothetical protein
MPSIKLELNADSTRATLSVARGNAELGAEEVDSLIRDLAALRGRMSPVHPAEPPEDPERLHMNDNLLWRVKADPQRSAIQFALQHPGLGWSAMWLSRAQVEDLQTSFEFELVKVPQTR